MIRTAECSIDLCMQPQTVCGFAGQRILFAADHVEDGPRGKHHVESQSATEREDNGLADILHEQTSFPG